MAVTRFEVIMRRPLAGGAPFRGSSGEVGPYEELKGRGVEFTEAPEERPYGIDSGFRDPSGNQMRMAQLSEPS